MLITETLDFPSEFQLQEPIRVFRQSLLRSKRPIHELHETREVTRRVFVRLLRQSRNFCWSAPTYGRHAVLSELIIQLRHKGRMFIRKLWDDRQNFCGAGYPTHSDGQ